MTAKAQMELLNLYKGQPVSRARYALDVMERYVAQKSLELRIKLGCTRCVNPIIKGDRNVKSYKKSKS